MYKLKKCVYPHLRLDDATCGFNGILDSARSCVVALMPPEEKFAGVDIRDTLGSVVVARDKLPTLGGARDSVRLAPSAGAADVVERARPPTSAVGVELASKLADDDAYKVGMLRKSVVVMVDC